jgi:hypothetical protein
MDSESKLSANKKAAQKIGAAFSYYLSSGKS